MPNTIGSAMPSQRVALATAMKAMTRSFPLCNVRNGAGMPRTAPCGTSRTPGAHQQTVHGEALGKAIAVLTEKCDAEDTSAGDRTALQQAVARLRDPSQPPLGTRVVNQLTVLGAVYAASSQRLEAAPDDEAAAALKGNLAKAIIGIGTAAGRCGALADGFYHADKPSKQLLVAIGKAQGALTSARAALGDQDLFSAMASTVMSSAMLASLNERLPQVAARFGSSAEPADLMQFLQKQYAEETQNAISRQLESGDPEDFAAAVFAFLKLPEYVVQACADRPGPDAPPAPNLPDLLRGLPGVPQGGNQAINYSPNTNTNNIDFGGFAAALRDIYNLGEDAGQKIGRLQAKLDAAEQALQERKSDLQPTRTSNADPSARTQPAWSQPPLSHLGEGIEWPDGMSDSGLSMGTDASDMEVPLRNPLMTNPSYLQMRPTTVAQRRSDTFDFGEAEHDQPVQPAFIPQPSHQPAARADAGVGGGTIGGAPGDKAAAEALLKRYFKEVNTFGPPTGERKAVRWDPMSKDYDERIQRSATGMKGGPASNPAVQVLPSDFVEFQRQVAQPGVTTPPGAHAAARSPVGDSTPDDEYIRLIANKYTPRVNAAIERGEDLSFNLNAGEVPDFVRTFKAERAAQEAAQKAAVQSAQSLFGDPRATGQVQDDESDNDSVLTTIDSWFEGYTGGPTYFPPGFDGFDMDSTDDRVPHIIERDPQPNPLVSTIPPPPPMPGSQQDSRVNLRQETINSARWPRGTQE